MYNIYMKKIVVGLSGGVDSSVCLYLIKMLSNKNNSIQVESVFMKNWDSFLNNDNSNLFEGEGCESNVDYLDAIEVSKLLDTDIKKVEFIKEYWDIVFRDFIDKYKIGFTPNPDILCNKYIKFSYFTKYAINELDADFIVTGHYARKRVNSDGTFDLLMPLDKHKDQTYFLCALNQEQLKKIIFPLANLKKEDVRLIAKKVGLPNADKKDSTGICFIGKRNFKEFLVNYIKEKEGNIVDLETNNVIGKHPGVWFYTIGQRKNIGISGMKEKYFVAKKDVENNILYVTSISNEKKFLFCNKIVVKEFNWINKIPNENNVKLRYRHCGELYDVKFSIEDNEVIIISNEKLKSVPVGQYAVLYLDDICLGGGEIVETCNIGEDNEKNEI